MVPIETNFECRQNLLAYLRSGVSIDLAVCQALHHAWSGPILPEIEVEAASDLDVD